MTPTPTLREERNRIRGWLNSTTGIQVLRNPLSKMACFKISH